jgi:hypothetical protein
MYAARFPAKVNRRAGRLADRYQRRKRRCPQGRDEDPDDVLRGARRSRRRTDARPFHARCLIDDAAYLRQQERFASWYESPIDLPGRVYLQVVDHLFKQNQLVRG